MIAEATSQHREPDFGLSAGIRRRQVWRPAGLRGVESILSNIANRNRRFDSQRARLTAWYEQFVQRSQPFIGWEHLTTVKFDAPDIESSFGSTPTQERVSPRESPMISKELPPFMRPVRVAQDQPSTTQLHRLPAEEQRPQHPSILRRSISGPVHTAARSMPSGDPLAEEPSGSHEPARETTTQPVAPTAQEETAGYPAAPTSSPEFRQPTAKDTRYVTEPRGPASASTAPTQRREEQTLERPALRLAILRPINTVAGTVQRKESGPLSSAASGFSMAETNDLRPEHSLVEGLSAFQPRLVSRASSLQRQEVRGGFPVPMAAEVRGDADTSSDDLVRTSMHDTSAFRNDGATESRSLTPSRRAEVPEPAAIPPMALPGVQIRLLKPDESASTTPPSGKNVAEGDRSAIDISKPKAPMPSAPPPLDINAVAEKVYQTLQRRLQFERERRGLY